MQLAAVDNIDNFPDLGTVVDVSCRIENTKGLKVYIGISLFKEDNTPLKDSKGFPGDEEIDIELQDEFAALTVTLPYDKLYTGSGTATYKFIPTVFL